MTSIQAAQSNMGVLSKSLLERMPTWQRRLAKVVDFNESRTGLGYEKFAQSTMVCLLPKLLLSRSPIEAAEATFQELIESAFFYFSIPVMAKHIFLPLLNHLTPSDISKSAISKNITNIAKRDLPKLLPAKSGLILASLSMVPMVYSLNFVKNLLTEKVFRKAKFSDVVNLSKGKLKEKEESPVAKKAYTRIAQCWSIAAGMILGGMALALAGHRVKALKPILSKFVQYFDLEYTGTKFGLSQTQLLALLWINGYSYVDAARDHLEKVEVATRVFGVSNLVQYPVIDILKGLYIKRFNQNSLLLKKAAIPNSIENILIGKTLGSSTVALLNAKSKVKTLEEIQKDCLSIARRDILKQKPHTAVTEQMLLQKTMPAFEKLIKAKNFLYWAPFLVSVAGAGFLNGVINRTWTTIRYRQSVEGEKINSSQAKYSLPLGQLTAYYSVEPQKQFLYHSVSLNK